MGFVHWLQPQFATPKLRTCLNTVSNARKCQTLPCSQSGSLRRMFKNGGTMKNCLTRMNWRTQELEDGSCRESNTPFAYIQDYTVHSWGDHHFDHLPDGSRGIDQFIGLADMVGKGHGQRFIAQHCQWLFQEGAPVIGTDPHPDNRVAIAVYQKLGFETEGAVKETPWGTILPMTLSQKSFKVA